MKTCSKCGKKLMVQIEGKARVGKFENMTTAGLHIGVSWAGVSPEMAEHIKVQLGKYVPMDDATEVEFLFCFECQIDSVMFSDPFPRAYVDVTAVGM